jgi:hypothetical protein
MNTSSSRRSTYWKRCAQRYSVALRRKSAEMNPTRNRSATAAPHRSSARFEHEQYHQHISTVVQSNANNVLSKNIRRKKSLYIGKHDQSTSRATSSSDPRRTSALAPPHGGASACAGQQGRSLPRHRRLHACDGRHALPRCQPLRVGVHLGHLALHHLRPPRCDSARPTPQP